MGGKNCVAIASDLRLGTQFLQISNSFSKIFNIQDGIILGLAGLATDVQTLYYSYKFWIAAI